MDETTNLSFTAAILPWYEHNGRDLPWRHRRDAYAVWLSEIILQQTRVEQGMAYWQRFMERYPTVDALAAASEDDVLLLWQGLGYYSRARHLHKAARQIVERGSFPQCSADLLTLSGIGPYTAAAIASIAFDEPVAAIDGNALRVLARYFGVEEPIDSIHGRHTIEQLAQTLVPQHGTGNFNQAVMDLGAMVCLPQSPRCMVCPLQQNCTAFANHSLDHIPVKAGRIKRKLRPLSIIYIRCNGYTAVHRRGAGDIWEGLYEPLTIEGTELPHLDGMLTLLQKDVHHQLTHQDIVASFYLLTTHKRPPLGDAYSWIEEHQWATYAKPRLVDKLLEALRRYDLNDN